jgi:dCMP deaminase
MQPFAEGPGSDGDGDGDDSRVVEGIAAAAADADGVASPLKPAGLIAVAAAIRSEKAAAASSSAGGGGGGSLPLAGADAPPTTSSAAPASSRAVQKRTDYLDWDEYFMAVAYLSAMRSKDPSTQVGACIVDGEQRIVGIGYNGFPRGCSDDDLPWARTADSPLDTKYPYVCHAEMNAVLNRNSASLKGCRLYVALFPCNECSKLIIQSGISEVIYSTDKYHDSDPFVASRRLLALARVTVRQYTPPRGEIVLRFG